MNRVRVIQSRVLPLRLTFLFALLLSPACGSKDNAPLPTEVVPGTGYATERTSVRILGSRFLASAKQKDGGRDAKLDTRHRAWLDDVELEEVTWVSATELTATVPAGLPAGAHRLTVENSLGQRGALDGAFTVLAGSALSSTAETDRAIVSEGQEFHLTLTVTNAGGTDATDFALDTPILGSPDGAQATLEPDSVPSAPATLAAGESRTFTWTFVAAKAGQLSVTAGATATDSQSGNPLAAPATAQVAVQTPPRLEAALSIPQFIPLGSNFTATMTVTNSGQADAVDVTPTALSAAEGSVAASPPDAPDPASATVPAGQSVNFTWAYTAGGAIGSLRLSGGAAGEDANSGAPTTTPTVPSTAAHVGNAGIIATIQDSPTQAPIGQSFDVTVRFENPGSLAVSSFRPEDPEIVHQPGNGRVTITGPIPFVPRGTALGTGPENAQPLTWNVTTPQSPETGELDIRFAARGSEWDGSHAQPIEGWVTAKIDIVFR